MPKKAQPDDIPFEHIKVAYFDSEKRSLRSICEEFKVPYHVVSRHATENRWAEQRRDFFRFASRMSILDAFCDQVEGMRTVRRRGYEMAVEHMQQLESLRRIYGDEWNMRYHFAWARALTQQLKNASLCLGIREEDLSQDEREIPVLYVPPRLQRMMDERRAQPPSPPPEEDEDTVDAEFDVDVEDLCG